MGVNSRLQFFIFENRYRVYNIWQTKNILFYASWAIFCTVGYFISFDAIMSTNTNQSFPIQQAVVFAGLISLAGTFTAGSPDRTKKTLADGLTMFFGNAFAAFFTFNVIIVLIKWLIIH